MNMLTTLPGAAAAIFLLAPLMLGSCASSGGGRGLPREIPPPEEGWRAVHFFAPWHNEVPMMRRAIEEKLAPMGINMIVLEVNYKYSYESHPELREKGENLTREDVKELLAVCRENDIRLVPMFMFLGHQSWAQTTFPLLTVYPELDETPQVPASNEGIYCRSWCPSNPKTTEIVYPMVEELIDAFEADAFHVGLDEVFLIASDQCPRCRELDPADVFTKAVNDYHDFIVKRHGLEMMMWGDRLIDCAEIPYGPGYECSLNGTAPAIDRIPKDIILCDWHYEQVGEFPSLTLFQEKGFRTMPATWRDSRSTRSFMEFARATATDKMVGHMFTTWVGPQDILPALLDETPEGRTLPPEGVQAAENIEEGMQWLRSGEWK
jgi:hypothetical protein